MGLFDMFRAKKAAHIELLAPAKGVHLPQAEIGDPVFAGGMMGKALGIKPSVGKVVAPIAGTVQAAMPHAVGLVTPEGIEIIIHIGIDTVEMAGEGFETKVNVGDTVQAGDELVLFDRDKIAAAGFADTVILAITNSDDLAAKGKKITESTEAEFNFGSPAFSIED